MPDEAARRDWIARVLGVEIPVGAAALRQGQGPLLPLWQQAKDGADVQLSALYNVLHSTGIPVLSEVAGQIEAVLEGYRVGLIGALIAYDAATAASKENARAKALGVVTDYRARLASDVHVTAADTNPFGVSVRVREPLAEALREIEERLSPG